MAPRFATARPVHDVRQESMGQADAAASHAWRIPCG